MTDTSSIDQIQVITVGQQGLPGTGIPSTVNSQTGTAYTFVLSDCYGTVTASNSSAQIYTIPANSSVPFPDNGFIDIYNIGTGVVTLAITGDTLESPGSVFTITTRNAKSRIQKIAPTVWVASGQLS
jgi:hypothetical protein